MNIFFHKMKMKMKREINQIKKKNNAKFLTYNQVQKEK